MPRLQQRLGTTRWRHVDSLFVALACETVVIGGGYYGELCAWDYTGDMLWRQHSEMVGVNALCQLDDQLIVAGCDYARLWVGDLTGKRHHLIETRHGAHCLLPTSSRTFLVGADDGTLQRITLAATPVVDTLGQLEGPIVALGQLLPHVYAVATEKALYKLDIESQALEQELLFPGYINSMTVPDAISDKVVLAYFPPQVLEKYLAADVAAGRKLDDRRHPAIGVPGDLVICNLCEGTFHTLAEKVAYKVASHGFRITAVSRDRCIHYDLSTQELQGVPFQCQMPLDVAVRKSDGLIVVADDSHQPLIVDSTCGVVNGDSLPRGRIWEIHAPTSTLLVSNSLVDATADVWNRERGVLQHRIVRKDWNVVTATASDGEILYLACRSFGKGIIEKWDLATGQLLGQLTDAPIDLVLHMRCHLEEDLLLVPQDREVQIWDTQTCRMLASIECRDQGQLQEIASVQFHPRNREVYICDDATRVTRWTTEGYLLEEFDSAYGHRLERLACFDDGLLAWGSRYWREDEMGFFLLGFDGELLLHETAPVPDPQLARLAINSSGTLIAIGTEKGKVHIYDVPKTRYIASFDAHEAGISSLCFLEEQVLATGSRDTTIVIWNL